MTQDDYIWRNEDKIILIQKRFRMVRARLKYIARRNEHRNNAKHFQVRYTLEHTTDAPFDIALTKKSNQEQA